MVRLDGASYIYFNNLTITASSTSSGFTVDPANSAQNIRISSCVLNTSGTGGSHAAIYSGNTVINNLTVENCTLNSGYYGIYLAGLNTSNLSSGNRLEGNTFNNQTAYALFMQYQNSPVIKMNTINGLPGYGMYLNYNQNAAEIIGNRIRGNSYGLYLASSTGGTGQGIARGLVANNFIYANGSYGMYIYNSSNQDIYYNSVNMRSNNAQSSVFYIYNGNTNNVVNNNFAQKGAGYSYYAATPAAINTSDYNNFYCRGVNSAYWNGNHTTLASFQSASGKDGNSVATNPGYFSDTDLHAVSVEINGKATPLARVLDDIDGDPRDASTPDIGADEFDSTAVVSIDDENLAGERIIPKKFAVYANYPNPFNPSTFIRYDLPQAVHVTLDVYNILGQHVDRLVDEVQPAGAHVFKFDAGKLSSGVYYYRITAGSFSKVHKMILQR